MSFILSILSAVKHRTSICQFTINHLVPLDIRIELAESSHDTITITEIMCKSITDYISRRRGSIWIKICLYGISTILHQFGNLCIVRLHVSPIKGCHREALTRNTMLRRCISRNILKSRSWRTIIVHYLSHCRRSTTCHALFTTIFWQQVIIR